MKKHSKNKKQIAIFEGNQIRRYWDDKKAFWYFSVYDVIAFLTKSVDPVAYWRKLKERLLKEGGNETVTKCHALKMGAPDGKMRLTDAADTETMFRLIQSILSPNAEPFKLWLAKVGYERVQEMSDPEKVAKIVVDVVSGKISAKVVTILTFGNIKLGLNFY